MYSLVLSGTPGKGGPSELEEPEEASSLHGKEAKELKIEVGQKHDNPRWKRGTYSKRWRDRRWGIRRALIRTLEARHCYRRT